MKKRFNEGLILATTLARRAAWFVVFLLAFVAVLSVNVGGCVHSVTTGIAQS